MSTADPSTAVPVVVVGAAEKENWTLTLIKVVGPGLAVLLSLVSVLIALVLPQRMPTWTTVLPYLAPLDGALIAAAFAGPIVKRNQEMARVNGG